MIGCPTSSSRTPRLRNGHAMTLWAWARPRTFPRCRRPRTASSIVAPDARVLAHCYWQPTRTDVIRRSSRCTASRARATRTTCAAWRTRRSRAGFNVVLLNQRNCGGTEHLSMTLYHSGLTADVDVVLRAAQRGRPPRRRRRGLFAGRQPRAEARRRLRPRRARHAQGRCAVSPVMDLPRCVDALERPSNFVLPVELRAEPEGADAPEGGGVPGAVLDRAAGSASAPSGSSTRPTRRRTSASATRPTTTTARRRSASSIGSTVPTLVIVAGNDPFVPAESFRRLRGHGQSRTSRCA